MIRASMGLGFRGVTVLRRVRQASTLLELLRALPVLLLGLLVLLLPVA